MTAARASAPLLARAPLLSWPMYAAIGGVWLATMAVPIVFVVSVDSLVAKLGPRLQGGAGFLFQPAAVALIGIALGAASRRWPDGERIARTMSVVSVGWSIAWAVVAECTVLAAGPAYTASGDKALFAMAIACLVAPGFGALTLLTTARPGSRLLANAVRGAAAPWPPILLLVVIAAWYGAGAPSARDLLDVAGIALLLTLVSAASGVVTALVAPRSLDPDATTPFDRP